MWWPFVRLDIAWIELARDMSPASIVSRVRALWPRVVGALSDWYVVHPRSAACREGELKASLKSDGATPVGARMTVFAGAPAVCGSLFGAVPPFFGATRTAVNSDQ